MKVLITGICGFIGHHLAEHIIKNTDWDIVGIDKLTYASNGFDRLRDINVFDDKRIRIFTADFTNKIDSNLAKEIGEVDYIVHMGAESITGNTYIPIQSSHVGTRLLTFDELWKQQLKKNKSIKNNKGEIIFLKGRQTKTLSFYQSGQWMPIKAITRHWYKGKIIRLIQK